MTVFDTAWSLIKAPIRYDLQPDFFEEIEPNPRHLYSGGHADDDFRYFSKNPNVALGIALFGSAIPRTYFPDDEPRYSRNPQMRQTVPRIKVLDTSMVDDDVTMFGSPYEAVLPSREISQRLEESGALTDIPQDRLEENLKQIIESAKFHRKRYQTFRDTGIDDWGNEIDDIDWMRERIPFAGGWWEMENPDEPDKLHPAFERLGMRWDPNTLQDEMWWPDTFNTSASYRGSPHSRRDMLNHVKGALKRLKTGVPGTIEFPDDQRKYYGIGENDDRPLNEGILEGWNA